MFIGQSLFGEGGRNTGQMSGKDESLKDDELKSLFSMKNCAKLQNKLVFKKIKYLFIFRIFNQLIMIII